MRHDARQDPFDGRFDKVKAELHSVLQSTFHGVLADALHIGNAAQLAFRALDGTTDISELSYRVTTNDPQ